MAVPFLTARRMHAWILSITLLLSASAFAQVPGDASQDTIRIGVATMLPGEIFWERFGHNAIVVDDPGRGEPISYNFGFFDLDEPGFIGRFVRGQMQYQLVALPFARDLAYYRDTGRGVGIQWLDLEPAQALRLAAALAENAKPQNARYDYDYFTDNCSTRVRDALDMALGGRLRPQLAAHARDNTYRSEAVRLASPAGWMWLGFDLGLGPFADRPLSLWQEAFVPMRLADSLRRPRARMDSRWLRRNNCCCRTGLHRNPWIAPTVVAMAAMRGGDRHGGRLGRATHATSRDPACDRVVDAVRRHWCADGVHLVLHCASRRLGQPEPAAVQSAVPAAVARRGAHRTRARSRIMVPHGAGHRRRVRAGGAGLALAADRHATQWPLDRIGPADPDRVVDGLAPTLDPAPGMTCR